MMSPTGTKHGRLVRGSDIDLVVILNDDVPDDLIKTLDNALYQEKYRFLKSPSINEEVDYVVKNWNGFESRYVLIRSNIWLRGDVKARLDVPEMDEWLESSLPRLFVAGELSGMASSATRWSRPAG